MLSRTILKLLFVSLFYCISVLAHSKTKEVNGELISIALSSRPSNLNPFFSTDANSQNINRILHKSLIDFSREMNFFCRLCKNFDQTVDAQGNQVLSFKLKEGIRFWDGSLLTSEDVRLSWLYFSENDKINSVFRFAFSKIKDVKIRNTQEFDIIYDGFHLDSLSNLALLKIIRIDNYEDKDEIGLDDIIGLGNYKIEENSALDVVLSPLDESNPVLNFKVVRDETTLALKLINGEIDFSVAHMSPRKTDWLKKRHSEKLTFHEIETSNFIYLNVNHRREALNNREVRKAIALLIPREKIIKYRLRDTAVLSNTMFSKSFQGFSEVVDKHNRYDKKRAIEILNEFGYDENNPLIIDWKTTSTRSTLELVQTFISFLEKGPIVVNLTIQEWGTFMRSFSQARYDIILGQWVGFTGPEMLEFTFHSEKVPPNGGNRGGYSNELVDSLLDKAVVEYNKEKRNALFKEVIKIVNEDFAYINLWHPKITWISSECIKIDPLYPNGSFLPFLSIRRDCNDGE